MLHSGAVPPRHRSSFADVLRVREFRWLWIAGVQSQVGDQLARVALAVLIFDRTHSPFETALVYALTFVPAILGAVLLSWLADRLPRRSILIACDLVRAGLLGAMALPGLSIWLLGALLIITVLVGAPFGAAQMALLPEMLGDRYVTGSGLRMISDQLTQVLGFGLGGAAVAAIGPRSGLLVDAISFAVSAVIIGATVARRAAPTVHGTEGGRGVLRSVQFILADSRLRAYLALGWLAGVYIVPEAVAAPYAHSVGAGAAGVGLLLATLPLGGALGAWILVRWLPAKGRNRAMAGLGVSAGLPLIACVWHPGLGWSAVLWTLSGFCTGYQVLAASAFVKAVPDQRRGRAVGLAASGLLAVQGAGALAGGFLGERVGMGEAVAAAGLAGSLLALPICWSLLSPRSTPDAELDRADVTLSVN